MTLSSLFRLLLLISSQIPVSSFSAETKWRWVSSVIVMNTICFHPPLSNSSPIWINTWRIIGYLSFQWLKYMIFREEKIPGMLNKNLDNVVNYLSNFVVKILWRLVISYAFLPHIFPHSSLSLADKFLLWEELRPEADWPVYVFKMLSNLDQNFLMNSRPNQKPIPWRVWKSVSYASTSVLVKVVTD